MGGYLKGSSRRGERLVHALSKSHLTKARIEGSALYSGFCLASDEGGVDMDSARIAKNDGQRQIVQILRGFCRQPRASRRFALSVSPLAADGTRVNEASDDIQMVILTI